MVAMEGDIWVERARWLRRRAENVLAGLLVAMFLSFMTQIIAR